MRKTIFTCLLAFGSAVSAQQIDSAIYVKQFPGPDVGTMVTNAMATCNSNASVPCILVIEPSLAIKPAGSLPSLCGHCYLVDWRTGPPTSSSGACVPGAFTAQTDGATVTWAIASAPCANASLTFTTHGGSRTLNLTGLVTGGSYVLKLIQDGTGGENLTGGTGCTWKQKGGGGGTFTLTATANAQDILAFTYDGTNCYANLGLAYN